MKEMFASGLNDRAKLLANIALSVCKAMTVPNEWLRLRRWRLSFFEAF
jgi:hypothetical protein